MEARKRGSMRYHYLVTTKNSVSHEFYTMREALRYQFDFGGVVYIVMGSDRALIA